MKVAQPEPLSHHPFDPLTSSVSIIHSRITHVSTSGSHSYSFLCPTSAGFLTIVSGAVPLQASRAQVARCPSPTSEQGPDSVLSSVCRSRAPNSYPQHVAACSPPTSSPSRTTGFCPTSCPLSIPALLWQWKPVFDPSLLT